MEFRVPGKILNQMTSVIMVRCLGYIILQELRVRDSYSQFALFPDPNYSSPGSENQTKSDSLSKCISFSPNIMP